MEDFHSAYDVDDEGPGNIQQEDRPSEDVNDEALIYIERLVRNHLRTVMEDYLVPITPSLPEDNDNTMPCMIQQMISTLEADDEVALAYLMKAIVNVRKELIGEIVSIIEGFSRHFYDTMASSGVEAGKTFLQAILEDMIQKEEWDEKIPSSEHHSTVRSTNGITISIGNYLMTVPSHEMLSCFWGARLHTACHTCLQPFVNEPPIRTFALHEPGSASGVDLHIQILNRHFSCLRKEGIFYVPVSHVWSPLIHRANESKAHDPEAVSLLFSTLEALFKGAEDAYGTRVEFWHDYFSVTQWESDTKESLLLCLPAIFHLAKEILVQMPDLPSRYVWPMISGNLLKADISFVQGLKNIPLLRSLSNSLWMQRMWVILEYSQSKSACIMDQSNHIHRSPKGNGFGARDTFTSLVIGGHKQLSFVFRHVKTFASSLTSSVGWLVPIGPGGERIPQLCLGQAVELLAPKECTEFRDRFLAIHVCLNKDISPSNPPSIPKIEKQACTWVWMNALNKGDCSPLLLQPRECIPSSNPETGVPSWLVGYQSLEGAKWGLSGQETPPQRLPHIISELAVQVELDLVGEIEEILYLDVELSGEVDGMVWVIEVLGTIANAENISLTPERLVDGLFNVFPFDNKDRRSARSNQNMELSFKEFQEHNNEFESEVEKQLKYYNDAVDGEAGEKSRRKAALEIAKMLHFDKDIDMRYPGGVTRFSQSRLIARHRQDRGAVGGEPICKVRCPGCRNVNLFRLDLRDTGRVGDILYRIPGLSYFHTVENGVGLVLSNGRITGRMLYGPPACSCQITEVVEIK